MARGIPYIYSEEIKRKHSARQIADKEKRLAVSDKWKNKLVRGKKSRRSIIRQKKVGMSGEITIFLSLILTCICALMSALFQSAQSAGSEWYLQMAADSSLDSVMSQYHRELWERYHLLLLEFEDENGLEAEMMPYFSSYLEAEPFYNLSNGIISLESPILITEQRGLYLEQEIVDYMKLGVFNLEKDPQVWEERKKQIKESDSVGELMDRNQMDTRKLLDLERAADAITDSQRRQEELLALGKEQLEDCNGNGFIRTAEKMKKELNKMPSLIKKYESEADKLGDEVKKSHALTLEKRADLQNDTWELLSEKTGGLNAYTDQEGIRRKEVVQSGGRAINNVGIVEAAIEEAEDTLDYINDWESDDDDDELDERPLWRAVMRTWLRFQKEPSLREPAIRDKKKMNLLESISKLASGDLLTLVVPDDRSVSGHSVNTAGYPSATETTDHTSGKGNGLAGVMDTVLINEYIARHFTNFLSEEENTFQYEQEYILNGENSDRENLKIMVKDLVRVRAALNLLCILKDSAKRREVDAMALTITGAAAFTPLTYVTSFFIMTIWSFAESLEDVRALLQGQRVPLLKKSGDWKTSLDSLMSAKSAKDALKSVETGGNPENSGTGLDYQDYLKLFLLMQKPVIRDYRMMDMVQENISENQKGFLMKQCAYGLEADCESRGRGLIRRHTAKLY